MDAVRRGSNHICPIGIEFDADDVVGFVVLRAASEGPRPRRQRDLGGSRPRAGGEGVEIFVQIGLHAYARHDDQQREKCFSHGD